MDFMYDSPMDDIGAGFKKQSTGSNVINKPAPPQKRAIVPWALKMWKEFTEGDKTAFAAHWRTLEKDQKTDYAKYLHNYCGAPHPSEWGI